jgi:hypothetical protein
MVFRKYNIPDIIGVDQPSTFFFGILITGSAFHFPSLSLKNLRAKTHELLNDGDYRHQPVNNSIQGAADVALSLKGIVQKSDFQGCDTIFTQINCLQQLPFLPAPEIQRTSIQLLIL